MQPRDITENRQSDSQNKNQLALSQWMMMKKGDDEDDELRTSQATGLCGSQVKTEEPFDLAQYL
jgi:hypothetical protein